MSVARGRTKPSGHRLDVDPLLAEIVSELQQVMYSHPNVGKLGLDWRVLVERSGRVAAEVRRSRDDGLTVAFYGDAEPEGDGA